ncbi:MAG: hypothetical protein JXA93_21490 [Anaerolineae bacterium]|nr:hypothetical protein [Anaerolineae bacterium]
MADSETKIITKLLERRQIEAEFQRLLEATSAAEFRRRAGEIAAHGTQLLPVIVANLDRADAGLLNAMGEVVALLDSQEAIVALREAVLHKPLTDRARLAAIEILERWLGWPVDDELLDRVQDPQGVVLAALHRALGQGKHDAAVLVDYIEGLDRQEPDVVLSAVAALRRLADADGAEMVIELLRMMALDVREEIGAAATEALGTLRTPASAWALQTLIPTAPLSLRSRTERLLRKLCFSGVEVEPLTEPEPGWRALVSPPSASGQQNVWFILEGQDTGHARFLNVLLHDRAGAVEAAAHEWVPMMMLLPARPAGYVHDVAFPDGSGSVLLVEACFDVGRRLVLDALEANRETQIPLAGTLRLRSPWLWGVSGGRTLPDRQWPQEPVAGGDTTRLLAHPALAGWAIGSHTLLDISSNPLGRKEWKMEVYEQRVIDQIAADGMMSDVLATRLRALGEWLLLAHDEPTAALALAAANGLAAAPREEPFLRALVRRDLAMAMHGVGGV